MPSKSNSGTMSDVKNCLCGEGKRLSKRLHEKRRRENKVHRKKCLHLDALECISLPGENAGEIEEARNFAWREGERGGGRQGTSSQYQYCYLDLVI